MPAVDEIKNLVRQTAAGRALRRTKGRREARRYQPQDPTLAAVRRSLLHSAAEEEQWSERIERRRAELEVSDATVTFAARVPEWWEKMIARSADPAPPTLTGDQVTRRVAEITRQTSKPSRWGRAFYRLVCELRPNHCLELGTSVGLSGSYLGAALAANDNGRLITVEGLPAVSEVAAQGFADLGIAGRVDARVGRFDEVLDDVLSDLGGVDLAFVDGHHLYEPTLAYFTTILQVTAPGGLLIFDDISYWHEGMERAWREIREHPKVTGSLTVEGIGFCVIDGRDAGDNRVSFLPIP